MWLLILIALTVFAWRRGWRAKALLALQLLTVSVASHGQFTPPSQTNQGQEADSGKVSSSDGSLSVAKSTQLQNKRTLASRNAAPTSPSVLVQTDMDCTLEVDGEKARTLTKGDFARLPLATGEHILVATTLDGRDTWRTVVSIDKPVQKAVVVELTKVNAERLAAEARMKKDADETKEREDHARAQQVLSQQQATLQARRAVITNRIMELQKQLHQEQAAAQSEAASAQQLQQQSTTNVGATNSLAGLTSQIAGNLARNREAAAAAHRDKAQQLQLQIDPLNQELATDTLRGTLQDQLIPSNSFAEPGTSSLLKGSSGGLTGPAISGAVNADWSESFLNGTLKLSTNKVSYEIHDRHGKLQKVSFEASCDDIKEWKADKMNFMNLLAPAYSPPVWGFHIRLKNGKNHDFMTSSEVEMESALQAVSKACGRSN